MYTNKPEPIRTKCPFLSLFGDAFTVNYLATPLQSRVFKTIVKMGVDKLTVSANDSNSEKQKQFSVRCPMTEIRLKQFTGCQTISSSSWLKKLKLLPSCFGS